MASVSGQHSVAEALQRDGPYAASLVIAVGKAACSMFLGALPCISPSTRSVIVSKYDHIDSVCRANSATGIFEAGHPVPDENSRIGIAYANPLGEERPGIIYPPNITPDLETGIGNWNDIQIGVAIRAGRSRHGQGGNTVMPWPGYSRLTDEDLDAIVAYLRSIEPVEHRVPQPVEPGSPARAPYVYFGVYERR